MKKVFITTDIPDVADELLKKEFEVVKNINGITLLKDDLIRIGNEYDAILTTLTDKFDKDVLSKCLKTKIFANYAVGYNNFDIDYIKENNIIVTNTPDVLSDTTAETALALLFAVSRRIVEADKYVRDGEWNGFSPKLLLGKDLYNKTIGIIGAGRIGHRFAEKIRGFHMKVIYHNRNRELSFEKSFNAQYKELDELLKESDIVTIHVPLTEETFHLINKRELELMKSDAILINTSRGQVVNEDDLLEVLESKKIYGAGLDVFENEPYINERFFKLDNVVLLPHIGSASKETREEMAVIAAKNIIKVLNGGEPINLVY
jgi:glyoxylate reductase